MPSSLAYVEEIERWRAERLAKLVADDGWLNLIGRWDLDPGTTTIGAAEDNGIVLPAGPERLGSITAEHDGAIVFVPRDGGEAISITPNRKTPQRFNIGRFLCEIIVVGKHSSLRIRDKEHTGRRSFPGIDYFEIDESWRITAEWRPLERPLETEVETMVGTVNLVTVTHKAAFTLDGVQYELLPSYGTPESPQFVIRDRTSGSDTYPASRFVYGEAIKGNRIVLDFNKAINPPCAFTDFAVCPLPPPQNILPLHIPVGERRPRQ